MRRRTVLATVAAALIMPLVGCGSLPGLPLAEPTHSATARPYDPAAPPAILEYAAGAELAATLPLIDDAEQTTEYRRDDFGARWADVDDNGCSQRQDVLARDLTDETIDADGCTILTGTLFDPYTATTIAFEHDRVAEPGNAGSQGVQIDHIVSLSSAHAGGAWKWDSQRRLDFANDFANLVAVDGPTNASKNDRGPAEWMPPNTAYWCVYALGYATIADAWGLTVEQADRDALTTTLTECAGGDEKMMDQLRKLAACAGKAGRGARRIRGSVVTSHAIVSGKLTGSSRNARMRAANRMRVCASEKRMLIGGWSIGMSCTTRLLPVRRKLPLHSLPLTMTASGHSSSIGWLAQRLCASEN